jgi:phytoene desaturase
MDRFEQLTQQSLKNNIIFKIAFCKNDFVKSITPIKNAYGMANTLLQTAFKTKTKSKKCT